MPYSGPVHVSFVPVILGLVMLASSLLAGIQPGAAQESATPEPPPVDLAAVPLHPSSLPERGFQLAQAGDLELEAVEAAWSGGDVDHAEWEPIAVHYRHGYSTVHVLLSDRAESRSEPLATVTTTILGLDNADSADDAVETLLDVAGYSPVNDVEGVTVYTDVDGLLGLRAMGDYVVAVQYASPEQQLSTRQNTGDWTPESIATLVLDTGERLDEAIGRAESGDPGLGVANVMVYGHDAPWTMPWVYYPSTEHYRVLNGEVVAYGGELDVRVADDVAAGIEDLFVSRQQIGQEGYEHLIDVTLARFESEADAAAFARDPSPVTFPPAWIFEPTTTGVESPDDDVRLERVHVDDDVLRASGFRTVRQDGEYVQVVQWLGSGNALVTEEAIAWLTEQQSACLDALPDPCAPIHQDTVPAALDERGSQDREVAPEDEPPSDNVLTSPRFGWRISIPDDGWELIDTELFTNSEYFQLQSGRNLITVESVVDRHGEPQQCVLDNLELLEEFEERAVIDLGSDDPDEPPAGAEPLHAWAVYTVEPLQEERADQEYMIRYDCYTLVPGEVSLVVTHTAPRDLWTTEREKGNRFRAGIELPESSAISHITPLEGDGRRMGRTLTMGIPRIWTLLAA